MNNDIETRVQELRDEKNAKRLLSKKTTITPEKNFDSVNQKIKEEENAVLNSIASELSSIANEYPYISIKKLNNHILIKGRMNGQIHSPKTYLVYGKKEQLYRVYTSSYSRREHSDVGGGSRTVKGYINDTDLYIGPNKTQAIDSVKDHIAKIVFHRNKSLNEKFTDTVDATKNRLFREDPPGMIVAAFWLAVLFGVSECAESSELNQKSTHHITKQDKRDAHSLHAHKALPIPPHQN